MASPLTHLAAGYGVYYFSREQDGDKKNLLNWRFFLIILISQLPDLDSIAGFVTGNLFDYHNHWSHSLIAGTIIALVIAICVHLLARRSLLKWWFIVAVCYNLQVIIDFFADGRGVMLFWPFSSHRFSSPIKLFYGLHWSKGWISIHHLYTLLNELTVIAVFVLFFFFIIKIKNKSQR